MATLRALRESKNLTQVDLAVKAMITPRTISRIEAGLPANRNTVKRLAEVLGVRVEDIEGVMFTARTHP